MQEDNLLNSSWNKSTTMNQKPIEQRQAKLLPNPMLGEVKFTSSRNKYKVTIEWDGCRYEWYVDRVRFNEMHYTDSLGMWCYQIHTLGIKVGTSVKRKMKLLVEEAVKNLA